MEEITLNHEEWFKIYMLFDTMSNEVKYNKTFLLFTEYIKKMSKDTMTIYLSSVESLLSQPASEIGQCYSEMSLVKESELSDDEISKQLKDLEEKYSEVLTEQKLRQDEVEEIVFSPVTITVGKILSKYLPELTDEALDILSPIIMGVSDE